MPADHQSLTSARRRLSALILALLLVLVGGCASNSDLHGPSAPDFSPITPAQQALNKALDAQAGDFAPRTVDAARRRITIARDILYSAAHHNRSLNKTENSRVQQLVSAAQLDARAALVEAQAKAVKSQIADIRQHSRDPDDSGNHVAAGNRRGGAPTGLGPSASGDARNQSGVSP